MTWGFKSLQPHHLLELAGFISASFLLWLINRLTNHTSPMARILWKGLSATKQFTGLFCLRLVFIRTTDKKLTGFDCKLFSCLLFVRQTLPRNRPRISYQFHPYSSFQGMVHFKAESVFIFVNDNFFYQQTQICVTQILFT